IVYYNIYNHTQQEKTLKFIKKPYSTKGLSKVWTKTSDKVGIIAHCLDMLCIKKLRQSGVDRQKLF
ncbi:hypothetical protein, partial [Streptococcus equi]|uniref:hypothetical protein n=1 Tax=Streptococcus equi TaxID=1336 RepID=UPI0024A80A9B